MSNPQSLPINDEITPYHVFLNRRHFIQAAIASGSMVGTAALYHAINHGAPPPVQTEALTSDGQLAGLDEQDLIERGFLTKEELTAEKTITNYNNFYEFTTDKEEVAIEAAKFKTNPWTLEVDGLVSKPKKFDLEALKKISPLEKRVYRMRCVEAWSMVIPWNGFPLSRLLEIVQPRPSAKYVRFETLFDPAQMPGQKRKVLNWPYTEGLRLDEAMHPLTILAMGLYDKSLAPQNGAPVRLVVPWKYGFKGIKSIVRIELTDKEPATAWNLAAPNEYGFYANVNPEVPHPRWSQATENRLGVGRIKTMMFNGYEEQVAHLYDGMDLKKNF